MRAVVSRVALSVVGIVAFVAVVSAQAAEKSAQRSAPKGTPGTIATTGSGLLAVGTIQYDNGTAVSRSGADGGTVGNKFAPDPGAHSINAVSFKLAGNYLGSVVVTVWDVNPGSFMVLQRQLVEGLPASPDPMATFMAALAAPVVGHTGSFVAGVRNTDYTPCAGNVALGSTCDGVALSAGGVDPGMGFHAHRVPFNSASFVPTVNTVAGVGTAVGVMNAIFRVTGEALPVELMGFTVD